MKKILLSIFKEYADKIISGEKRFEFRKKIPRENISHIVFHTTAPDSQIVCIAEVKQILADTPQNLWKKTAIFSGVKKDFFFSYFKGAKIGYAYELKCVYKMKSCLKLDAPNIALTPPQSFKYISENLFTFIKKSALSNSITQPFTIFLAGIHGVGKTSFANKYLRNWGFHTIASSDLIKRGQDIVNIDKRINDISNDQEILIHEFYKERIGNSKIALDGHLTLINKHDEIKRVSINVIKRINPSMIILLESSIDEVHKRIWERDKIMLPQKLCKQLMNEERIYAIKIAEKLKIPITIIPEIDNLKSFSICNK